MMKHRRLCWLPFISFILYHLRKDSITLSQWTSWTSSSEILESDPKRSVDDEIYSLFDKQKEKSLLKNTYNDTFAVPIDLNQRICFSWQDDNYASDHWWTHHPMWNISTINDTHTCFQYDSTHGPYYLQVYKHQFLSSCENATTRYLSNSGFSADIQANFILPLIHQMRSTSLGPLVMRAWKKKWGWHYSANAKQQGSNPTCPQKDLSCYFLPHTHCPPARNRSDVTTTDDLELYTSDFDVTAPILYHYVARPRQWIRHRVYNAVQKQFYHLQTPCTVLHVRRADVILHQEHSRKYYPISDYMKLVPSSRKQQHSIFLLTDDANAIDEALEFFPHAHWFYFNRSRFRGAAGGWENQIPSGSPKSEMITILTTFELVKRCDTIVYGKSGFADMIVNIMKQQAGHDNTTFRQFRVDEGGSQQSLENRNADKKLEQLLQERRSRQEKKKKKKRKKHGSND